MNTMFFKTHSTQLDRIKASINLLGLDSYITSVGGISIDPEKRLYKIALVFPSEDMLSISGDRKGVTLSIPLMPEVDLGLH